MITRLLLARVSLTLSQPKICSRPPLPQSYARRLAAEESDDSDAFSLLPPPRHMMPPPSMLREMRARLRFDDAFAAALSYEAV